jgi:hypothetical protein
VRYEFSKKLKKKKNGATGAGNIYIILAYLSNQQIFLPCPYHKSFWLRLWLAP